MAGRGASNSGDSSFRGRCLGNLSPGSDLGRDCQLPWAAGRVPPQYAPKYNPEGLPSREKGRCTIRGDLKEQVGFNRPERLARVGARRAGVGSRARPSQRPRTPHGLDNAPGKFTGVPPLLPPGGAGRGTHGGRLVGGRGWAAGALLSGAPLGAVRAGGWGVESGLQQGFYGAPSPQQEGGLGQSRSGDAYPATSRPRVVGDAGKGPGAAVARVLAPGAAHTPTLPPQALPQDWGLGTGERDSALQGRRTKPKRQSLPSGGAPNRLSFTPRPVLPETEAARIIFVSCPPDNQPVGRQGRGYLNPLRGGASPGRARQRL